MFTTCNLAPEYPAQAELNSFPAWKFDTLPTPPFTFALELIHLFNLPEQKAIYFVYDDVNFIHLYFSWLWTENVGELSVQVSLEVFTGTVNCVVLVTVAS